MIPLNSHEFNSSPKPDGGKKQKRGNARLDSAPHSSTATSSAASKNKPRRPSVREIRDGTASPVTQQQSAAAAPPSAFKVPSKPSDSKPRSSSLGRSSSLARHPSTTKPRAPSLDRAAASSSARSNATPNREAAALMHQAPSQARSKPPTSFSAPLSTRKTSTSSNSGPPMHRPPVHATPNRSHMRATSVQETSTSKPIAAKASFSTYQQHFTPAKKLPPSASAPQRRSSVLSSTASPRPSPAAPRPAASSRDEPPPKPPAQSLEHLRAQTHLLHLSLLHRDFHPNYIAWKTSAHDKLSTRFSTLQSNYSTSLALARAVRQARNLLALNRWTNGNTASLTRKLTSLAEILRLLCELTADDRRQHAGAGPRPTHDDPDADIGDFTRLAREFESWVDFVQDVWTARDARAPRPSGADSPPLILATPDTALARGRRISREPGAQDADIDALAATPIPGLGDAFKASLRAVGSVLDRLAARLAELRDPYIPLVAATRLAPEKLTPLVDGDGDAGPDAAAAIPSPRYLADLAWELVRGMRDEVQVMREAEFEIDLGEKAWAEQRVRAVEREVQGGWGTPGLASAGHDYGYGSPLPATLAGKF